MNDTSESNLFRKRKNVMELPVRVFYGLLSGASLGKCLSGAGLPEDSDLYILPLGQKGGSPHCCRASVAARRDVPNTRSLELERAPLPGGFSLSGASTPTPFPQPPER